MSLLARAQLVEIEKDLRSFDLPDWQVARQQDEERIRLHGEWESEDAFLEVEFLCDLTPDGEPPQAEVHYIDYRCDREVTFTADYAAILDLVRQMLGGNFQVWSGSGDQPIGSFFGV